MAPSLKKLSEEEELAMTSMHFRPATNKGKYNRRKRKSGIQRENSVQQVHEIQYQLQEALRHGLAVENILWSSKTADWVVGLHAADIDGDGNIEIVVGSRDGWVKAFTHFGSLKWGCHLENSYLSALTVLPLRNSGFEKQPAVILGLRSGKVIALDKDGVLIKGWEYYAERIIRRITISEGRTTLIVIGSEDRSIHVLDSAGKLCWKYRTQGWIRCVFVADVDGDGRDEILAGSGDKKLYIFDTQGHLLYAFDTGYRIYSLYVAQLEPAGPMSLIMSSSRKDLMAWQVKHLGETVWKHNLIWFRSSEDGEYLFANRVQSISVYDVNKDGNAEILVGSEDGHLGVLDYRGQLLWKQDLHACIYTVHVIDINYDGVPEVLVGTEDSTVYVLQLELIEQLFLRIKDLYKGISHFYSWKKIAENLALREQNLLQDFVDVPKPRPKRMELDDAKSLIQEQKYEQALAILLRLFQQKVQYCWSQPFVTQGYIRTSCFRNLVGGESDELLVGTEQGYIYALDITQAQGVPVWSRSFAESVACQVRMICSGPVMYGSSPSVMAVLDKNCIVLLDRDGQELYSRTLEQNQNWFAYFHPQDRYTPAEVFIGLENNRIVFWDGALSTQTGQFETGQGTGSIFAYDLFGDGTTQIVSGGLKNGVYAYTRKGEKLWEFKTQDRVGTVYVADIDKDGYPEVIAGSEDRNVYVLDYQGHLKWRYRTLRGTTDIDVCDIKIDKDSDDPRERGLKILISSDDNYLYMLDCAGELVWKYQCPDRVRMVQAKDVNRDGIYEITLSSEDQLELLQILKTEELQSLRDECWRKLSADFEDHNAIRRLSEHPDEYMRGGALAVLAGLYKHDDEDFRYLLRALREDGSLQVKRELVHAIRNLCKIPMNHEKNVFWARQLLEGLYHTPEEEIRMEIVQILPLLDEGLFSEYLERSTDYPNIWVRRAVVRRLDMLVEQYPELVFRLLLKTAKDEDEWVRQESGRVLAHYFDVHIAHLVSQLFALLDQDTDPMVFQQIAYSTKQNALKGLFLNLFRQFTEVHTENVAEILSDVILHISNLNAFGIFHGEELLQIYEEFQQILFARSISEIAAYQRVTRSDILQDMPLVCSGLTVSALDSFEETMRIVAMYERRQSVGERVSSLIEAQHVLEKVRSDLRQPSFLSPLPDQQEIVTLPDISILTLLVKQWSEVISNELARMRGAARLVLSLGSNEALYDTEIVVSLSISNEGQCSADNVRIELEESPDFRIVDSRYRRLIEISTKFPASVDFTLHLHGPSARLAFCLTYDDAEKRGRTLTFADKIVVHEYKYAYHVITNPYTTGTPIREKEMFYGRKEDLKFLRESLGSLSTNRVALLWGQRRMGKTSLIYQLASELATGRYAPVFIDLQDLALKENSAQLLESFAYSICKEIWHYKGVRIAEPISEHFYTNASSAFREYLASVWEWLPDHRIILLIDEFDGMRQYVERDGEPILHYLRSLMQHYPGLNVLLAGAPQMPYTEGYHSVLFNIAQSRKLGKLRPEEARELIVEPVRNDLEYDSLALQKMLALTDGWPYFIHVMSEKLIEHCNIIRKPYVTVGEINKALELVLNEQSSSIRWIWQDLTSPIEKLVLSLMAQDKGEDRRIFSLNDLRREFDAFGVQYIHKDVIEALSKLTRGDFIEEMFDGIQYSMPVGLIKAWLRKDKSPERVVREEMFFENDLRF